MDTETQKQPVTFRSITPVFHFRIDDSQSFNHSGTHRNANFVIDLRPYGPIAEQFNELARGATDFEREELRRRAIHISIRYHTGAKYLLVIDVKYEPGTVADYDVRPAEVDELLLGSFEALRLHSSGGFLQDETYSFRFPSPVRPGVQIVAFNASQSVVPHLPRPSVLRTVDFEACRATIDNLLTRAWNSTLTVDNLLQLAKEYHRTSFNLEHTSHAFLILMVIFEAFFRSQQEQDAGRAAHRIGRFLGSTKGVSGAIAKEFFDNAPDCFCRIRNQIAHGDPGLDAKTVSAKHPKLYAYVTDAIIRFLSLPPGTLDAAKDYYEEINRYVQERFAALPPK